MAAYGRSGTSLHVREAFSASLSLFFVWGSYFVAGLWAARERERLLGWLEERRLFCAGLGAALYAASLWEFGAVHESTRSLGLAASFFQPTSARFALAACAFFLGTTGTRAAERVAIVRESPPAGAWEALATGRSQSISCTAASSCLSSASPRPAGPASRCSGNPRTTLQPNPPALQNQAPLVPERASV